MNQPSVFLQIIKHIPRTVFQGYARQLEADKGVRKFDSWSWFGSLLFSQLSGLDSLRALESVFACCSLEKHGFVPPKRSTFSDANRVRSVELLEHLLSYVQEQVLKQPRKNPFSAHVEAPILLLDSTFIELCLSLCPWAGYRKSTLGNRYHEVKHYGGIKLHTAVDLAGVIPSVVVIQEGTEKKNSDITVAHSLNFEPDTLIVADRGYCSAQWFHQLNQSQVGFVVRAKNNFINFKVIKSHSVDKSTGLRCDQHVYYAHRKSKKKYTGKLRRIVYRDPDTAKLFEFLTNRFDLAATTICDLYKSRWMIEAFFKTLKQQFRIKKFLGLNFNAVKAQVLVALIAYLICNYLKLTTRSGIPMTDLVATISTLLLMPFPLWKILKNSLKSKNKEPPLQLQFAFP